MLGKGVFSAIIFPILAWSQVTLQHVSIVTAPVADRYYRTGNYIYAADERVQIGIVITARIPPLHSPTFLTECRNIIIGQDTIAPERCARWQTFSNQPPLIRWYLILPERTDTIYRNSRNIMAPWVDVKYQEIPLPSWENRWLVDLDELPARERYLPGTIWLKVAVAYRGQYVASPGTESKFRLPDGHFYGGLSPEVCRISVRGNSRNPFADNLIALRNLPYIANANSWNGYWADHQTKCWIGGNRDSFYQMAAELAGRNLIAYYQQLPLPVLNRYQLTDYYAKAVTLQGDVYTDKGGEIFLSRNNFGIGDFILASGQEGILYTDCGLSGHGSNFRLDGRDLVAFWAQGELRLGALSQTFGDTLTLVRWIQRW